MRPAPGSSYVGAPLVGVPPAICIPRLPACPSPHRQMIVSQAAMSERGYTENRCRLPAELERQFYETQCVR